MTAIAELAAVPILPVLTFGDPGEAVEVCAALREGGIRAVEIALRTPAALASIERVASEMEAGLLGINTTVVALPEVPFGGIKQSGFGREGGAEGVREYLQTKLVHINSVF